jgi:tetratricopeptide (TPR) repeat protein
MRKRLPLVAAVLCAAATTALLGGVLVDGPAKAAAADEVARGYQDQMLFAASGDPAYLTSAEAALRRAGAAGADPALVATGRAVLAATRHRFALALAQARLALRLDPYDASAYGALGDALVEQGRYREAFAAYDRMAHLAPSVASYARVATARELLGRRGAALEALRLALELERLQAGERAYLWVRVGRQHQDTGRLGHAARAYRRALREAPGYVFARAGLATLEADRGRFARAFALLRPVVAARSTTEYAVDLGDALAQAGRSRAAEAAYALARRLERQLAANGVRTELQSALFDLDHDRNLRDALVRAREGRRLRPGIEGEHVLAWALYKNGRCAEARVHSIRALRLGTKDLDAIYHRSLIEDCLGNRRAAAGLRAWLARLNPFYLANPPSPFRLP